VNLVARNPDATVLNGIWERIMKCAQAGALASETRMEFIQETNYANVVPNETLSEVLGRAMTKAGGYEYTPAEQKFATEIQKTLERVNPVGPEKVTADRTTPQGMASSDAGDVSWNIPMAQFTAATFVPGVGAHTWQGAACAGTSIGRKGMLVAARTLALGAMELFEKPEELLAAKADFEKRKAGRIWTTRIQTDDKPPFDYATHGK
jgi:aminobenzoyl-glutamate utilization protein B